MNVPKRLSVDNTVVEKKWLRRAFGDAAPGYDGFADLQKKIGQRLLNRLNVDECELMTVLDIGCGTGFCIAELGSRRLQMNFIGLDIAMGMLQEARRNIGCPTEYVCGDAAILPLSDNSVDLIVSNLALQWCPNLAGVFSEVQRVLKPGKWLFFATFGRGSLSELRDAWRCADSFTHVNRFYEPDEIKGFARVGGLADPVIESELFTLRYHDVAHLMGELKGLGAHNVTSGRRRGLTGKGKFARMIAAYESMMQGTEIYASYEVLFGRVKKPLGSVGGGGI